LQFQSKIGLVSKKVPHNIICREWAWKVWPGAQVSTFQAHSLQMILWRAFLLTSPILLWNCNKLCPYNYNL